MKPYLLALSAGILAGVVYGILNIRSPAPPIVALVGLLGILAGEQIPPLVRHAAAGARIDLAVLREHCRDHVFGNLPARGSASGETAAGPPEDPAAKRS